MTHKVTKVLPGVLTRAKDSSQVSPHRCYGFILNQAIDLGLSRDLGLVEESGCVAESLARPPSTAGPITDPPPLHVPDWRQVGEQGTWFPSNQLISCGWHPLDQCLNFFISYPFFKRNQHNYKYPWHLQFSDPPFFSTVATHWFQQRHRCQAGNEILGWKKYKHQKAP